MLSGTNGLTSSVSQTGTRDMWWSVRNRTRVVLGRSMQGTSKWMRVEDH